MLVHELTSLMDDAKKPIMPPKTIEEYLITSKDYFGGKDLNTELTYHYTSNLLCFTSEDVQKLVTSHLSVSFKYDRLKRTLTHAVGWSRIPNASYSIWKICCGKNNVNGNVIRELEKEIRLSDEEKKMKWNELECKIMDESSTDEARKNGMKVLHKLCLLALKCAENRESEGDVEIETKEDDEPERSETLPGASGLFGDIIVYRQVGSNADVTLFDAQEESESKDNEDGKSEVPEDNNHVHVQPKNRPDTTMNTTMHVDGTRSPPKSRKKT